MNIGAYKNIQSEFVYNNYRPPYCGKEYYDPDGDGWIIGECVVSDLGRVSSSNGKETTVVTYMKQTTYSTKNCDECNGREEECEEIIPDYCRIKESNNFIMAGVENLNYTFSHKIISFLFIVNSIYIIIIIIFRIFNYYSPDY